ncbi:hypothetical protein VTJ04DRAFT_6546 [Mycothermus thermophilus]|uniref:uncharacterized protein n=1 Tax=Humicola insolens TaxID=85995 RepID=UPI0037436E96
MAQTAKLPIIDISGDGDQTQVATELVEAAIEHGFLYIRNTGADIPVEAVDQAFEISKKLFDAPLSEKQACAIQQNNRGWSGMNVEKLDPANQRVGDFKEAFNFGDFLNGQPDQPLPATITPDAPAISQFKDHCYHLTLKLLSLIGIGLGVDPPNFFTEAHLRSKGPSGTILRFLRYPPRSSLSSSSSGSDSATPPPEDGDVRAGAHSDYGSLTLLFRLRGQPGLEILLKDGKTWAPVPVVPPSAENDPAPPILVNIGDLLSYWTNGLLRSTVHRVVFPSSSSSSGRGVVDGETDVASPRYSIAYFCHPHHAAELTPVPSERVRSYQGGLWEGNPYSERRVMTAEEHLKMRLRESYEGLYGGEAEKKKG